MHLKDLLGSIVRVGYRIPVPDFYLVLHGLRCRKSTIMDSTKPNSNCPVATKARKQTRSNTSGPTCVIAPSIAIPELVVTNYYSVLVSVSCPKISTYYWY